MLACMHPQTTRLLLAQRPKGRWGGPQHVVPARIKPTLPDGTAVGLSLEENLQRDAVLGCRTADLLPSVGCRLPLFLSADAAQEDEADQGGHRASSYKMATNVESDDVIS